MAAGQPVGGGRRPRRWPIAVAAVLLVLVAGFVAYAVSSASRTAAPVGAGLPTVPTGKVAPTFSLPRLGGGAPVSLAAYRGKPAIVNFFASWCVDCRAELAAFGAVSSADRGVVHFVGVDANDTNLSLARSLLAHAHATYPVGIDANGTVASEKYVIAALPVTYFLDSSGRVAGEVFGAQSRASLESWVAKLTSRS
ncbi:MAG TPA: TlpA disulfide reductase family protein [Acidimicrobiales bacterium]|nr:TlpA disulfide reductase family protein [Acidimicrobiales bacterium]